MRKMIQVTLLIILLISITTGCWNRRELNQLSFVMALGIDKHDNQIELSAQVANVGEIGMGPSTEGGTSVSNFHVVSPNIYEGLRKMTSLAPRELYLSHLRMLVISEELAREGVRDVLDFFMRNEQMRPDYFVAIARDVQAKEVLSTLTPTEKIPANKLYSSLKTSQNLWAPTLAVHVDEFVANLVALGKEPVLTGLKTNGPIAVSNKENKLKMSDAPVGLIFTQIGVFRGDRLVGWLNEQESKGYNYISGNVKSTVGHVALPDGGEAAIHILRTKSKVTALMKEGKPVFTINLQLEGDVGEVEGSIDLTKSESIYLLEQAMEKKLKEGMEVAVSKAQKLESDIFGFGEILHRSDPGTWKQMQSDWPSYFVKSETMFQVDAKLRRTGKVSSSFIEELKKKTKE
ncbi:Ger(x)C family spore germination protein [Paenibacillus sp. 5J-6]|uniref:Ger(X)C family spore germination protein n=1 Tax=Paenibacillus silvestris TaxID=2606219 RepID=A0A6L8V1E8_9BACL|nr:Ger(x)C family spore germination protein [Paenibacillus silvestris]MZQ84067.1 Ger(x)C family spore germination protein [Paenibacillus silvestris]